jgi:two-component system, cell cycle sensor histidine kinase and response regulator CckA
MQGFNPTVLVVEDEPGVRNLIVTLFRLDGFDAIHCADAVEARDLMAVHGGGIRLLVTDVNLGPEEDGVELARGLQEQYPGLRVLYISGLVDEGAVFAEVSAGRAHFISKPFTPRSLADKVMSILDARYRVAPGHPILD